MMVVYFDKWDGVLNDLVCRALKDVDVVDVRLGLYTSTSMIAAWFDAGVVQTKDNVVISNRPLK